MKIWKYKVRMVHIITLFLVIALELSHYIIEKIAIKQCLPLITNSFEIDTCIWLIFRSDYYNLISIIEISLLISIILSIAKIISDSFYYIKNKKNLRIKS